VDLDAQRIVVDAAGRETLEPELNNRGGSAMALLADSNTALVGAPWIGAIRDPTRVYSSCS